MKLSLNQQRFFRRLQWVYAGFLLIWFLWSTAVLVCSFINPTSGATGLNLATTPTLSMSTVNANISLSPNPFANEGVASTSSTVTLTTNVFTGYNLTLSTNSTNDNGLVPQNVGSPTPLHTIPIAAIGNGTTTGTITNPIVLTNNTWGFAIPKVASSSPTNTIINNFDTAYTTPKPNTTSKWASVPKQGSPVTIKNTAQAASNDSTIVYYAAKVGADLPPDEYKQTIMYTATANTDIGNIPAPTIISITPNQGPTTGNTNITIVGTNFTKYDQSITTSVTIGGKVCNNVQISSNTPSGQSPSQDTITCITQDNTVGKKNVTVATWSSGSPAVNGDDVGETGFTYVQLPVVTSVSPNQGVTEGGTVITVAGTGFGLYSLNGYEYTTCGSYQTFTANVNGDYKLDVYGAQGGTASSKTGGKGGFSTGKVALNVGDVLYVYVGCAGSTGSAGGWNGGGGAASTTSSGTGGGASDIRLVANASPTNLTSLQSRIIVAGGGAGSGQDSCATAITGYGGGETGGGGASQGDCGTQAGGGTQSAGGGGGVYGSTTGAAGQFGIGGTAINASYDGGGGGGGWYGGGAGASAGYSNAGGGGSGYLFTSTSDKTGYSGNIPNSKYYLSDAFTVTDSRTGGGYVKIVDLTSSPTGSVILDISGTPANCIIISWSDTEIKCATSSHVAGVVDVTVTSIDGSASVNNGTNDNFEYQVAVDPTIMSGWVKSYDDVNNYYDSAQDYYYFEIEFDVNMLPIVHRETGGAFPAYWCDYVAQRWCNAVTLVSHKNPSANGQTFNTYDADGTRHTDGTGTYTPRDWYILHAPVGTEVSEDDILGYWVYIPRFAYQVNRLSATDPAVCAGGSTTSGTCSDSGYYQGTFDIVFQKRGTSYCSPSVKPTAGSTTKCTPTASGHWATHPAFTIGSTELAGLWVGKFETTGSTTAPTVKPNLKSQAGFDAIGTRYDIAGSAGKTKPTGSNNTTITQNNQNFQRFNTHQQKNVEWGAVAYLSASAYGTNDAKVLINSAVKSNLQDGNGSVVGRGITGCGPRTTAVTDDNSYSITDTNTTGAVACMYNGVSHSYDTSIGVLASTTHNVYGVYDMNGGEWESVLGYNGSISDMSNPDFSSQNPNTNLVNFYPSSVFNGVDELANNSFCTWQYCGGHALHEVRSAKTISAYNQSWGSDGASFVFNDGQGYRWFIRGGFASHGDGSGVWASAATNGTYIFYSSFRIVASSF